LSTILKGFVNLSGVVDHFGATRTSLLKL